MQLKTESGRPNPVINFDQVRDALANLDENKDGFVILEDDERFVQTAFDGASLVVEKCDGTDAPLYRANRNGSEQFALADVEAIFRSWYEQISMPFGVQWAEQVEKRGGSRWLYWLLWALPWIAGAYLVYRFALSSYDLWEWLR